MSRIPTAAELAAKFDLNEEDCSIRHKGKRNEYGILISTIAQRLDRDWSAEKATTVPADTRKARKYRPI